MYSYNFPYTIVLLARPAEIIIMFSFVRMLIRCYEKTMTWNCIECCR